MSDPTLILGAGLAGLSCAHALGGGYRLFERQDRPGGLARTDQRDGFAFDATGHWLHFRDPEIRDLYAGLLGDDLLRVERRAAIFSHGVLTPYPFQANTHGLPSEVTTACVLGYFRAREARARGELADPKSFEDYVRATLGDGIAEQFMLPYNHQLWTVPPREMSHEWCARFVPIPTPEEVVNGALRPAGAGHRLGYNPELLYPRRGGIESLVTALHAALSTPAEVMAEAVAVDWRRRTVRLADGREEPYQVLVSTMPLDQLVARLSNPPAGIPEAAAELRAASVTYWNVGVARPNEPDDPHWIYYPGPETPFYRVGSASAVVPELAPPGHRSYYVEVSHPQGQPCPVSDEEILAGLRRVGLLHGDERPVVMERHLIDCAYVIMDHAYGPARRRLLDWLAGEQILSIGRYGDWIYDSMEGATSQGRAAAVRVRELLG